MIFRSIASIEEIFAEVEASQHRSGRRRRICRRTFRQRHPLSRWRPPTSTTDLLDYAPIVAAGFAIPQFLPQIVKLRRTGDTAGVSWSWAALTSLNNAAWLAYFALSEYWTALVPSSSATLLAGALAAMLTARGQARTRPGLLITSWVALLITGFIVAGRTGLGILLTAAFILQVTPSIWTAYRTERPTGISPVTWTLILGELSCWTTFAIHKSDPRLMILGATGVTASILILTRIHRTRGDTQPPALRRATI
jgi:uncharacterized protein with PQ loop repeat